MSTRARTTFPLFIMLAAGIIIYIWYPQPQQKTITPTAETPINHSMKHLAVIMDGNRRWAKKQGLATWLGHKKGTDPVKTAVEFCVQNKIAHLSLYAFSLENLKRSQDELNHLFTIIEDGLTNAEFEKLIKHGVKVHVIGDRALFPEKLRTTLENIQEKTKDGQTLTLNIMFCYGGQQELTYTMQRIGEKIERGELKASDISADLIQENLWTYESPNPDLIIRTGGCKRLSNFLPWQSAYSELLFIDTYWPDITQQDLSDALEAFTKVQRNFGA
jgi:undecaprenyl diphosphate synthase